MCPSILETLDLHTHCSRALKIVEKDEINSHKWVQESEPGTPVDKVSRAWGIYSHSGAFSLACLVMCAQQGNIRAL